VKKAKVESPKIIKKEKEPDPIKDEDV